MDENIIDIKTSKRGRKPKPKDNEELIEDDVVKKKRGRKPTGKIYEINKSLSLTSGLNMPNCIIAHLPLNDKDIEKIIGKSSSNVQQSDENYSEQMENDIEGQSNISLSFDQSPNKYKPLVTNSSFIIEADDDINTKYVDKCAEYDGLKKKYDELMEKFKKFSYLEDKMTDNGVIDKKYYVNNSNIYDLNGNCWSSSTDKWCLWCSHGFDTVPVGLPEKYCLKEKKYYLRGCFCSFNCALKYNFECINDYKVHERYSLLNTIKKKIFNGCDKSIIPAPPREVLSCFGGEKSIEEFRSMCIPIPKEYNHLMPPMIPIFTVIEEIPKFFYQDKGLKKKNDFGDLKIKRSKPILTQNNNLLNLIK